MRSHSFVFIQEHWLLSDRLQIFQEKIPGIGSHGISAIDAGQLLIGRPHGGCSILWNNDMNCAVTPIATQSKRLCAVSALFPELNVKVGLFCVYMPTDTSTDHSNKMEFINILEEITALCTANGIDEMLIGGDLNTDLKRLNSLHTNALLSYVNRENLIHPGNPYDQTEFTFQSLATDDRSYIDHFFISESLYQDDVQYSILHEGDNVSDHAAVSLTLSIPVQIINQPTDVTNKQRTFNWKKATDENMTSYRDRMLDLLCNVATPADALNCDDPFCKLHIDDIMHYHDAIVDCCLESSRQTIPVVRTGNIIPGWHDSPCPELRQKSIFWHDVWKNMGCPKAGIVAQQMRSSRAEYHRAVRQVKASADSVSSNKLATALLENRCQNFWKEIKLSNKTNACFPTTVDGSVGVEEIADVFVDKYETLYNSTPTSQDEMSKLCEAVNEKVADTCCRKKCNAPGNRKHHKVVPQDIEKAIHLLKREKKDGNLGLCTDHIINGPHELHVCLALLFSAMISHGTCPPTMMASTVIPIPKNIKKSLSESKNYRGVALNSPLSKLFELVILSNNRDILRTSDLQFGFKENLSTTKCTFVLLETIQYYLSAKSDVYAIFLDASQAFDGVHYGKLFRRLLDLGLCPLICRVLMFMHTAQTVRIRWAGHCSRYFHVQNGVKQGGILSPVLFTIYADVLLGCLRETGLGCYIGNCFHGALGYADDIVLLCPSMQSLNDMLAVADSASRNLDIKFNPSKCQLLKFSPHGTGSCNPPTSVDFCKQHILQATDAIHLGHTVGQNWLIKNVTSSAGEMYRGCNLIMSKFGHCQSETLYKLFKSYSTSAYGSCLWNYDERDLTDIYLVAWRKCVRRLWRIPYATHSRYLNDICRDVPMDFQLHSRLLNFITSSKQSNNTILATCMKLAISGSRSSMSDSISLICDLYNLNRYELPLRLPRTSEPSWQSVAIRDFASLRDSVPMSSEDFANIQQIISYIATS